MLKKEIIPFFSVRGDECGKRVGWFKIACLEKKMKKNLSLWQAMR